MSLGRSTSVLLLGALLLLVAPRRALAGDPESLDDVVAEVRRMKAAGASNRELAQYVVGVADRRITNGNSMEGGFARSWGFVRRDSTMDDMWENFDRNRERIEVIPGRAYESYARWAWGNRYGHCAENSALTYFIFKSAGIPARMLERPGHAFTAIGVVESADSGDLSTWGPDAWMVDSWTGIAVRAEHAGGWRNSGNSWRMLTHPFGRDKDPTRTWIPGYDNEPEYQRWKTQGLLLGWVTSATTKNGVKVPITIVGEGLSKSLDSRNISGSFSAFLPEGIYTVTATPSDGGKPASETVTMTRETRTRIALVLGEQEVDGGVADAGAPATAGDGWVGLWHGTGAAHSVLNGKAVDIKIPITVIAARKAGVLQLTVSARGNRAQTLTMTEGEGGAMTSKLRVVEGKGLVSQITVQARLVGDGLELVIKGTTTDAKDLGWQASHTIRATLARDSKTVRTR
ncbi:MAG: hypothetical protein IT370_00065 [Deltaproteobacteria bacterium]|nr:hypothetical protein [Deltaproteobacteria bacterium]